MDRREGEEKEDKEYKEENENWMIPQGKEKERGMVSQKGIPISGRGRPTNVSRLNRERTNNCGALSMIWKRKRKVINEEEREVEEEAKKRNTKTSRTPPKVQP